MIRSSIPKTTIPTQPEEEYEEVVETEVNVVYPAEGEEEEGVEVQEEPYEQQLIKEAEEEVEALTTPTVAPIYTRPPTREQYPLTKEIQKAQEKRLFFSVKAPVPTPKSPSPMVTGFARAPSMRSKPAQRVTFAPSPTALTKPAAKAVAVSPRVTRPTPAPVPEPAPEPAAAPSPAPVTKGSPVSPKPPARASSPSRSRIAPLFPIKPTSTEAKPVEVSPVAPVTPLAKKKTTTRPAPQPTSPAVQQVEQPSVKPAGQSSAKPIPKISHVPRSKPSTSPSPSPSPSYTNLSTLLTNYQGSAKALLFNIYQRLSTISLTVQEARKLLNQYKVRFPETQGIFEYLIMSRVTDPVNLMDTPKTIENYYRLNPGALDPKILDRINKLP